MPNRPPAPSDLVKRFDLLKKGHENGSFNLPPATQPGLDSVESEVESWCHSYHKERLEAYRKDRDELTGRMKLERPEEDADAMAEEHCQSMKATVGTAKRYLSPRRKAVEDSREKLRAVMDKHGLDETATPRVPESVAKFAGTLGLLILIETLVNGFFFGAHMSGGLLGGTSTAVLISLINVLGLGWAAGMLVRMTAHRHDLVRLFGVLGILVVLAAAVLLNLFVAHFRDALPDDYPPAPEETTSLEDCLSGVTGEGPVQAGREARCLMFKGHDIPRDGFSFALDGFESYILMAIGLMMFGWAAWKWWRRQDPYPDFSQAAQDCERAKHDLDASEGDLLEELERDRKRAVEQQELHARKLDPVAHYDRASDAYDELCKRLSECREDAEYLEKSCRSAIASYRSENRALRTEPEPKSWGADWTANWKLPEAPIKPDIGTRTEAKIRAAEAKAVKELRIKKLNDCYKECETDIRKNARSAVS